MKCSSEVSTRDLNKSPTCEPCVYEQQKRADCLNVSSTSPHASFPPGPEQLNTFRFVAKNFLINLMENRHEFSFSVLFQPLVVFKLKFDFLWEKKQFCENRFRLRKISVARVKLRDSESDSKSVFKKFSTLNGIFPPKKLLLRRATRALKTRTRKSRNSLRICRKTNDCIRSKQDSTTLRCFYDCFLFYFHA